MIDSPVPLPQPSAGEVPEYPKMLVLSFVYPCNAQCPHCPYTNSNIRKEYRDAPYMSAELFRKIAEETGPHGAYLRISGGGEPMLHPQATELLVQAKALGCKIGLISNGSRFTEDNMRALLTAGIDMIEISVDACDPETYARVRKGLDWETLLTNVRRMLALRIELGSTSRIVCSTVNQKGVDVDRIEAFWRDEVGLDYVIKRKFLTWGINTTLTGEQSADPSPYLDVDETPCPFIFERLNIDSRGNVMVCGYDISANTQMGNVLHQSIRDIWHGPGFRYYRERHLAGRGKEIGLCAGCPDWQYRSWTHNYWKVTRHAEENRRRRMVLDEHDDIQSIVEK